MRTAVAFRVRKGRREVLDRQIDELVFTWSRWHSSTHARNHDAPESSVVTILRGSTAARASSEDASMGAKPRETCARPCFAHRTASCPVLLRAFEEPV